METIKTPDFTRVIAEIRTITGIGDFEAEALQELLKEYCVMVDEYYIEEYHNALDSARNSAYDDGYDVGYFEGYEDGYAA